MPDILLLIKNMVCDRCKLAISNILNDMDIAASLDELGVVDFLKYSLSTTEMQILKNKIEQIDFEIILSKKIKNRIFRQLLNKV